MLKKVIIEEIDTVQLRKQRDAVLAGISVLKPIAKSSMGIRQARFKGWVSSLDDLVCLLDHILDECEDDDLSSVAPTSLVITAE